LLISYAKSRVTREIGTVPSVLHTRVLPDDTTAILIKALQYFGNIKRFPWRGYLLHFEHLSNIKYVLSVSSSFFGKMGGEREALMGGGAEVEPLPKRTL